MSLSPWSSSAPNMVLVALLPAVHWAASEFLSHGTPVCESTTSDETSAINNNPQKVQVTWPGNVRTGWHNCEFHSNLGPVALIQLRRAPTGESICKHHHWKVHNVGCMPASGLLCIYAAPHLLSIYSVSHLLCFYSASHLLWSIQHHTYWASMWLYICCAPTLLHACCVSVFSAPHQVQTKHCNNKHNSDGLGYQEDLGIKKMDK